MKAICLPSPGARCLLLLVLILLLTCAAGAQNRPREVWVTMGDDFFTELGRASGILSSAMPARPLDARGGVVVTRLAQRDLESVSAFGHRRFRRCGGFAVHGSRKEAIEAMHGANALHTKMLPSDFAIDEQATVNSLLPLLDKNNIFDTIDHLSTTYTNRYFNFASGQQSALWIRDLWQGYAGSRSDVSVVTFDHSGYVQPSVILTINGTSLASEIIVVGGHLDSIRSGGMTTGTVAPGADDNASGIATISEVIRVLMENDFTPDRTVKFMGYAAEEVGLRGSGEIAQAHLDAGEDVVAVMQLDMTDFNGSAQDISLIDDFTNADLRTFVGELIDTYQPSLFFSTSTCGYACSDHASWHNRGFAAVMPFEAQMGQHNPRIHTSNDTLANLGNSTDHALKFAKLALSFVVETALSATSASCTVDADCDDGTFCNGAETCNAGTCQDGPAPCSGSQICNESGEICEGGGCAHSADFESGAAGWTNGADSCTTGAFTLGAPDATAWQVGGGNPGNAFYTRPNPGGIGSDDVDGGTCEALSPTVNCGGEAAAEVTLDYFHGQRDAADDSADGFTVELLNDGAVVETLVAIGDVTHNPAWTRVSTVVSNPGNLQLRVRASDGTGGGDIIEGGIDNVSISAAAAPPPPPPPPPPPSCTLDEDFESGSAGWDDDPASNCATGAYVLGNPTNPGGGQQIVGSHSGTGSLFTGVNTSAGNADVDGGNCILASPTLTVGQASTLSVWYWHGQRDTGDDAAGDFFRLEYSTDGGTSYTVMASNGDTAAAAAWTRATAPIAAGSNVKVRLQCSDGSANGDLVECGIDDVSICAP